MQAIGSENDNHSNDEVPYPPQYSSPLIHGAVASPPLCSPKVSPQPIVIGANNSRVSFLKYYTNLIWHVSQHSPNLVPWLFLQVSHPVKSMVPLEPLKIDPTAGYYYLPNTSPQSRPALAVQSPSPQPRAVHNTPSIVSSTVSLLYECFEV